MEKTFERVHAVMLAVVVTTVVAVLPTGPAVAQDGWVCLHDPAGDGSTTGPVPPDQTRAIDLVEVCGLYQTDGTLTLDFTVVDAAPDPSWPDDAPPAVNSLLDSPEFVFVEGIHGGRSDVYAIDQETGLEPYCPQSGPQGSATLQLVGNTYRLQTVPDCIDVPTVSTRGFGSQRFDQEGERSAADEAPAMQLPRTDAEPPPLGTTPPPPPQDPAVVIRLAGPSRVETAVAVSRDLWAPQEAQGAVIATAGNFADAQTATPLAVGHGPLLLSGVDGLHAATAEELTRAVRPGATVHLVGGTAVLTDQVAADVRALGFATERLAGPGRAETSVAIAEQVTADPQRILFVDGGTFPPGVLAGAVSGLVPGTVVVSGGAGVDYIAEHPDVPAIAIGATTFDPEVDQVVGASDPTGLSLAVAEVLGEGQDVSAAALASAADFPDGLAGSTHAATLRLPLYLTPPEAMPSALAQTLSDAAPDPLYVYGGQAAVATPVTQQAVGPADGGLVGDEAGLAGVAFGTSQADTVEAISAVIGPPDHQSTSGSPEPCFGDITTARWGDPLDLELGFYQGEFSWWQAFDNSVIATSTPAGLAFGQTQAEIRQLYPDAVFDEDAGRWSAWLTDRLLVGGSTETGVSDLLFGGTTVCGE